MLADSGVLDAVSNRHFDVAIGSSGTIETIAEMIHANVEPEGPDGAEVDKKVPDKKGRQFKEEEFTKEQLQGKESGFVLLSAFEISFHVEPSDYVSSFCHQMLLENISVLQA